MSIGSVSSNSTIYYQTTQTTKNSESAVTTNSITRPELIAPVATSSKWGFTVDKDGYFGVDFNKAAGLPENMKINQKMMEKAQLTVPHYLKSQKHIVPVQVVM